MLQPADRIEQAGIMAVLQGDFALHEIIEMGDALLAAPVLALEISLRSRHAVEALVELRQRAGPHMLIGAGGVDTVDQVEVALAAEAQFIALAGVDPAVIAHCHACQLFAVPLAATLGEVQQAQQSGCRMVKFLAALGGGPRALNVLRAALGQVQVVVSGDISPDNVADYARAGATAVAVGHFLLAEPYHSMAEIITKARTLQAIWEAAKNGLHLSSPG